MNLFPLRTFSKSPFEFPLNSVIWTFDCTQVAFMKRRGFRQWTNHYIRNWFMWLGPDDPYFAVVCPSICTFFHKFEIRNKSLNLCRYRHEAVSDDKYLYILGGGRSYISYGFEQVKFLFYFIFIYTVYIYYISWNPNIANHSGPDIFSSYFLLCYTRIEL